MMTSRESCVKLARDLWRELWATPRIRYFTVQLLFLRPYLWMLKFFPEQIVHRPCLGSWHHHCCFLSIIFSSSPSSGTFARVEYRCTCTCMHCQWCPGAEYKSIARGDKDVIMTLLQTFPWCNHTTNLKICLCARPVKGKCLCFQSILQCYFWLLVLFFPPVCSGCVNWLHRRLSQLYLWCCWWHSAQWAVCQAHCLVRFHGVLLGCAIYRPVFSSSSYWTQARYLTLQHIIMVYLQIFVNDYFY